MNMSTLTYKEVDSFLFNNIQHHQFLSNQPRELNGYDMDFVSGGNMVDDIFRIFENLPRTPRCSGHLDMREAILCLVK
jgi:hypothetical protein